MATRSPLRTAAKLGSKQLQHRSLIGPSRATFSSTSALSRTAIITGASRGIGKAIATRLASDGYSLCLNDLPVQAAALQTLATTLQHTHPSITTTTFPADVSCAASVSSLVAHSVATLGPLTTMIANAGIAHTTPLLEHTPAALTRLFAVNVLGVYNAFAAAAAQLIAQGGAGDGSGGGGKLVACSSIVAFRAFPLLAGYSASKWAVRGLVQAFAMDLARHGVTVNGYAPGIVGTEMWEKIDERLGEIEGRAKGETLKKYVRDLTALGRTSTPEDVAKVVGFLSSPDADFMTGQTVVVDGGIVYT